MPVTYWSFRYTLPFIRKKASIPPVGLITVAALLPETYEARLIDMNVAALREEDVAEADLVFTSSMMVQKASLEKVIALCNRLAKPIVAGGPYPTTSHHRIQGVDHFVLNEAEVTLPAFLADFEAGRARRVYADETKPDITRTPMPRFDLLDIRHYASMALQYSRGCPFSCEFCDIVAMFGHVPRTKTPQQFEVELEALYDSGFRGALFVVDDNFIGNKKNVKQLLPVVAEWQRRKKYPFRLFTEASVNLAEDDELLDLMAAAGFNMVFLGIETPVKESLVLTRKMQNVKPDLLKSVHKIQHKGMEVTAGFIVGFDNDPEDVFDRQIHFIQQSGIPAAMVGLLTALPNTQLYNRLKAENRLVEESSGNNVAHDLRVNFLPRMDVNKLVAGYRRVISEIYKPGSYFDRCWTLLKNWRPRRTSRRPITATECRALVQSLFRQTFSHYGLEYVRFLTRTLLRRPTLFAEAIALSIKGHHFLTITREVLAVDRFKLHLEKHSLTLHARLQELSTEDLKMKLAVLTAYRDQVVQELRKQYRSMHEDFQPYVEDALRSFELMMNELLVQWYAVVPQPVPVRI
jgi:radical SAM superfamily enzyme YgiQ (UPF0313 family)